MGWRERYREASFKGINFFVAEHEAETGRRLSVNEYPFRDEPYTEDLGGRAKRYNVTGYLVGDEYMTARDELFDAVEEGGAGTLVHPYLGTKDVVCETFRARESKDEGGYIVLTFNFVQAGRKIFPNAEPAPVEFVSQSADSVIAAARSNFVEDMVINLVPEWVRENYSVTLQSASDIFNVIRANGGINKQSTTALVNQAAVWVADVADLSSPSSTLLTDLNGSADRIIDTMMGVFDLAPSSDVALKNLQEFSGFSAITTVGETALVETSNNNALISETFIKTVSLANEAKALVNTEFTSYEDAISSRQGLLDRLDVLAGQTTDDVLYESFRGLRSTVATSVPGEENDLPRISEVSLKTSLPSLVLAYDLYEDVDRESDIVARNQIRHPAFMPGGKTLSVLDYAEN